MPNGQRYSILQEYNGWQLRYSHFHRVSGPQVFMYNASTNSDELWFDFSLQHPDTIGIYPRGSDTTIVYYSGRDSVNLFGANRQRWFFWLDYSRRIIDEEELVAVVEGIGVALYSRMWGTLEITGAIINGVQYGTITNARNAFADETPSAFSLLQNFPNPFNPVTAISYQLTANSFVTLKVYDLLGREVATLVNEEKPPGTYTVQWDGSNQPTGIYFYRLTAGALSKTMKAILLR